ncbi:MAG: hypothetical protein AMXMBFR84_06510 [Candidatus Hydrogenedentota bacterium]
MHRIILSMLLISAVAWAKPASVEVGRDVGDGNVLYNTPYDPKDVDEITFVAPTSEYPYYEIVVPLGDWTEGTSATVASVHVNRTASDSFYLFRDGFSHVQSGWITRDSATAKNVVLVTRSAWHSGEEVQIHVQITYTNEAGSQTVLKTFAARAPETGGVTTGWKRYQSVVLHEEAGLARENEPVECTIAVRAEDCADLARELRIVRVDKESGALIPVPFQVFNPKEFEGTPTGTANTDYLKHPSKSVDTVFFAKVDAKESETYVFLYDNPDAETLKPAEADMKVTGESLGAVVENEYFIVDLDDKSGQIASFQLKGRDEVDAPLLTNSMSAAVHWNPDSFSDNGKWGHTFAWDPPEQTTVSTRGPLMFRVTNRGRMPEWTPQVYASVTYTFYAGVPYVDTTTVLEVRDWLNASAIRNGEIVLDSHLVDHFVWRERTGKLRINRTMHGPNWQDEWATRVEHDVPWLALTNEAKGYGVGTAIESSQAFSVERGEATLHRRAFYLYYHHFWQIPLTYFTRGLVYPFSDYQRGPLIQVEPGSTYLEKMAFIPFYLDKGKKRYQAIDNASTEIRHPLIQRWGR